jgi:2-keto-4-pentenoate hydratase/2-oxohepta-3-ene-1,7-dioic acid hydratase in catechol pathway
MQLASFTIGGRPSFGAISGAHIVDFHAGFEGRFDDLRSYIAAGMPKLPPHANEVRHGLSEIQLLPVIPSPPKIICVGLNYRTHLEETGKEQGAQPVIFLRVACSQVAHEQPMVIPRESNRFDYEGELAVVIGKPGRRIAQADAWDHIAGYSCYNDGSVRDWQTHTSQWAPGKNFAGTGAFGPWMVTADEIEPGQSLALVTRLNGEEVQRSSTDLLIFDIPRVIEYVSSFMPLEVGDVIATGTPGGVGAKRVPPLWMKAGDVVEVEIDQIGVLRNPIVAET